ncbi:MAG: ADP-ribose pyrophosphatase [Clostridia bacterium]|nr:ADP-ribose pyrophosphatase [Clostridia bacterium]
MQTTEEKEFLSLYSDSKYEKPSVTVDGVIFRIFSKQSNNYRKLPQKKLQVFLTKRQYLPFKNKYSVVGTFIDLKHELNNTMKLCVKNKVGLNNYHLEQLFTFGEPARDPRTRVLSVGYMLLTNSEEKLDNGKWFDVDLIELNTKTTSNQNGYTILKRVAINLTCEDEKLENIIEINNTKNGLEETKSLEITKNELAFDHISIIYYALERLKNKLEYTDIIFNLLPKEFTLTELKQCYELILREHLLDANFRRKISKMVSPINKFDDAKGHRTSQLFIHNPNWLNVNLD